MLLQQEAEKLIDRQQVSREARHRVEQGGMIFLDEIDKIAGREGGRGPDVSREGVQRDLLPIVEGTTVSTKYGMVKTDHILFIAAGAFHVTKPSDLIPELQGRFPIRVELDALTEADFVRILTEPETALTKQYPALLAAEGVEIEFTADAVAELARLAVEVNSTTENIGARRLATLMERLLEEVSFEAPDMAGSHHKIDGELRARTLADIVKTRISRAMCSERAPRKAAPLAAIALAALALLAAGCGKKGDPMPPLPPDPQGGRAISRRRSATARSCSDFTYPQRPPPGQALPALVRRGGAGSMARPMPPTPPPAPVPAAAPAGSEPAAPAAPAEKPATGETPAATPPAAATSSATPPGAEPRPARRRPRHRARPPSPHRRPSTRASSPAPRPSPSS